MKAVRFESFGAARDVLLLAELPDPEPAPGEVLVALRTSAVNPSDVKKRAGSAPALLDEGFVIPHSDGAGVIEAVGDGVDAARLGERVWVYQAQHGRRFGTAAGKIAIAQQYAVPLPDNTGFDVGACLGIPAMTAHRCVFADGPVRDQWLLITGGAGRVGFYAIQWASQAGARVIATASNPADADMCRTLGAAAVVNHRDAAWPADVLECTGGQRVDRVIEVDFAANLEPALEVIRTSGTIATYASMSNPQPCLPFYRMMFMDLTVRLVIVYDMPDAAKQLAVADINAALSAGSLRHQIAHRLPLAETSRAHELIEQGGFRGCVIVETA